MQILRLPFHSSNRKAVPLRCVPVTFCAEAPSQKIRNQAVWYTIGFLFVYRIKPTSIADWKAVVECIDPDISRKSCASARTRFEMMMML